MFCHYFAVFLFILFSVTAVNSTDIAVEECTDAVTSTSQRLRRKLFCAYDRNVRPVLVHTNKTDVKVYLNVKSLVFEEEWSNLEVYTRMEYKWKDEYLNWDGAEYDDQTSILVSANEIWLPDLEVYFASSMSITSGLLNDAHCTLSSTGDVSCWKPSVLANRCDADVKRWPFDQTNCTVDIGSWTQSGSDLHPAAESAWMVNSDLKRNGAWELLKMDSYVHELRYENSTYYWIKYSFLLTRHSGGHAATVVMPSFVLTALTLVIFWLQPDNCARIVLICISILCHCIFLQYLGDSLPSNGDNSPVILLFFRDSLLLVGVSLFITLLVRRMDATSSVPPVWITTSTDVILATLPGQILMRGGVDRKATFQVNKDGVKNSIGVSRNQEQWRLFAMVLDRVTFLTFTLTFIILLAAFVP